MSRLTEYSFPNTYALVMCGGGSTRMGTDKSMLIYHEKPQRYHVYDLLQPFCEKVFISCNHYTEANTETGYSYLADNILYKDIGPMAALITAFETFPGKNILLIGCDYPFLNSHELQSFSLTCNANGPAAFYNEIENLHEPLLAWYTDSAASAVKQKFHSAQFSLRHLLEELKAIKHIPNNSNTILSVDTMNDFIKVHQLIHTFR